MVVNRVKKSRAPAFDAGHKQVLKQVETTEQTHRKSYSGRSLLHVVSPGVRAARNSHTCSHTAAAYGVGGTPCVASTKAFLNIFYRACAHKMWQLSRRCGTNNVKTRTAGRHHGNRRTCVEHVSALGGTPQSRVYRHPRHVFSQSSCDPSCATQRGEQRTSSDSSSAITVEGEGTRTRCDQNLSDAEDASS